MIEKGLFAVCAGMRGLASVILAHISGMLNYTLVVGS